MTSRAKIEIISGIATGLLLLIVLYFLHVASVEHARDQAAAEATTAANAKIIAAKNDENQALAQQMSARDQQYQQTLGALQREIESIRSAAQARPIIVPMTGGTAPSVVQRDQLPAQVQQSLPSSPSYTLLTEQQTIDAAKYKLACDKTVQDLGHCQADLSDTTKTAANLQDSLKLSQQDTEKWKQVANGGGFGTRLKRGIKHIICGGGAATAGVKVAEASDPKSGAAVAAGGLILCEVLTH